MKFKSFGTNPEDMEKIKERISTHLIKLAEEIKSGKTSILECDLNCELINIIHPDFTSRRRVVGPTTFNLTYLRDIDTSGDGYIEYTNDRGGKWKRQKGYYVAILTTLPQREVVVCCEEDGIYVHGSEEDHTEKIAWMDEYPVTHGFDLFDYRE